MSRSMTEEGAISRYDEIITDFKNLAINRFIWSNLPSGLTSERLEMMLMEKGQLMCFKRSNGSLTILPCSAVQKMNVYGEYDDFEIMGFNGYTKRVNIEEGVRIKNNPLATNNLDNLMIYAKRIDDIEMTQDVNLFQQNIPKIILTDESGKLTAKNLVKSIKDFKFIIFGRKSLSSQLSTSEVLDTSAPYLLDSLQDYKNNLLNEVLTYLGINNNNTDKKERLVVDEVNSNNDYISINLDLMFDIRVKACKDINSMFGADIKVEKREVKNNEPIHNNDTTDNEK